MSRSSRAGMTARLVSCGESVAGGAGRAWHSLQKARGRSVKLWQARSARPAHILAAASVACCRPRCRPRTTHSSSAPLAINRAAVHALLGVVLSVFGHALMIGMTGTEATGSPDRSPPTGSPPPISCSPGLPPCNRASPDAMIAAYMMAGSVGGSKFPRSRECGWLAAWAD